VWGQPRDKSEARLSSSSHLPAHPPVDCIAARPRRRRRSRAKGKRGAIYARYSSRFQHSIEDQIRECRTWAQANGINVADDHVFTDEKVTGKKNRRAGFQALMRAVAEGKVDVVIIFTTNRLFRKTYRALRFVEEEIVDRRKRCVFVKSGIDTEDKENWRKLLHLHSLVDELSVTLQAAHIRAAHEGQLRLGIVFGTLTYGFTGEPIEGQKTKLGKPARRLAIDPQTSEWVRRVFAWFVNEDLSIADIARQLNAADAPLPKQERVVRWTRIIVRRMLDNPRYRGVWRYGATEVIWQNKADYGRQFDREEPLAVVELPHLRIIDDRTWHEAQRRLADHHAQAGRKPKNGDSSQYPRLLNRLCYCEKHAQQQLWVGGANGKYLFCPVCRTDPDRALVSQLPRVLATRLLCGALAQAVRGNATLVASIVESCRRQAAGLERPDPQVVEEKRREEQRLTAQIQFVMNAPGETQQDHNENLQLLANLRNRRAEVQAEIQALDEAATRTIEVPTPEQVREMLDSSAQILTEAAESTDQAKVAAARRIVHALTGGRIVISQQGEPKAKRGWLKGSFTLHLMAPILRQLGANIEAATDDRDMPMHVDFRRPTGAEDLADEAKSLLDKGLLVKQIAIELSRIHGRKIGRNLVAQALEHLVHVTGAAGSGWPAPPQDAHSQDDRSQSCGEDCRPRHGAAQPGTALRRHRREGRREPRYGDCGGEALARLARPTRSRWPRPQKDVVSQDAN
jgi:predicted site-specific integrase-resolvase